MAYRVHSPPHGVERTVFELAVEVHPTGKYIRARKSHIRESGSIRTATNRLHLGRYAGKLHGSDGFFDNLGMRLHHLPHIVILIFEFERHDVRAVLAVDVVYGSFDQFFLLFKEFACCRSKNNDCR